MTLTAYAEDLGEFEPHAIDTTDQESVDTALDLQKRLAAGKFKLRTSLSG